MCSPARAATDDNTSNGVHRENGTLLFIYGLFKFDRTDIFFRRFSTNLLKGIGAKINARSRIG